MILIAILDVVSAVILPILDAILPELPPAFLSAVEFLYNIMANAVGFAVNMLCTPSYLRVVISFVMSLYIALYGLDLIWKVINLVKLNRE